MKKVITSLVLLCTFIVSNSQEIKTYKGSFPNSVFSYVYILEPRVEYSYYENEDLSRVYNGPFVLRFTGDGSTQQKTIYGSMKGQFKDGYFDGDWVFIYPISVLSVRKPAKKYTATLKCHFKDGYLDGPVDMTITNSLKNVVSRTTMNCSNGKADGDFSFFNKEHPGFDFEEMNGKYERGQKTGKWSFSYRGNRGLRNYENDEEYMIDSETGERLSPSGLPVDCGALGTSMNTLLKAIDVVNRDESKRFYDKLYSPEKVSSENTSDNISKEDEIYVAVEQMAEFPGGQAAINEWLSNNLRYPEAAQENGIQGRVLVEVVIEKDGSISHPKIRKGVDKDLDREALRVVKSMPKWQPGKNNGVAVRSYYRLPVVFKMPN